VPYIRKEGKKSHSVTREGNPTMTVKPGGLHHGNGMGSASSNHSSKHGTFGGAKRIVGSGNEKPRRAMQKRLDGQTLPVSSSGTRAAKDRDEFGKGEREQIFQSNA
jgi:hypothetical protein